MEEKIVNLIKNFSFIFYYVDEIKYYSCSIYVNGIFGNYNIQSIKIYIRDFKDINLKKQISYCDTNFNVISVDEVDYDELYLTLKDYFLIKARSYFKSYNNSTVISLNDVDGCLDVDGNVTKFILSNLIKDGKLIVKFGTVKGYFDCSGLGLETLEGCPHTIIKNDLYEYFSFDCGGNNIKTLKGGPSFVEGGYICNDNSNLISVDEYIKCDGVHLNNCNNVKYLYSGNNYNLYGSNIIVFKKIKYA